MLPEGWTRKSISQILERVNRPVAVRADSTYREIGIRSHCKGIFHKEPVLGKVLGDKRVFQLEPNCFVVNIVFAWEQAVAKTTENEIGMIASHRFPTYKPKDNQCDIDFILYLFKTEYGKYLLGLASPGGAGRNKTLGQTEFSRLEISIPPVSEQTKIARMLSCWDKSISIAEQLLLNSQKQKKSLIQQLITGKKRFLGFSTDWQDKKLSKLCTINPTKPQAPGDGKVSFIPMGGVSESAQLARTEIKNYEDVYSGFPSFIDNDVLIAKITPCFENGKGAYASRLVNGVGFGSTEFHVLRANSDTSSRLIYHITCSSKFRVKGELNMQGSAGQKRVTTDYLKNYTLSIPSDLNEQNKIAKVLTTSDAEIIALSRKIESLRREKNALTQALLTGQRRVKMISNKAQKEEIIAAASAS